MPQSPYDWTGKRTEKRDRQRRVLVVTAIAMGALILVLGGWPIDPARLTCCPST